MKGDGRREPRILDTGPGSDTVTLARRVPSGRALHLSGPQCLEGILLSLPFCLVGLSRASALRNQEMWPPCQSLQSPGYPAGDRLTCFNQGGSRAATQTCQWGSAQRDPPCTSRPFTSEPPSSLCLACLLSTLPQHRLPGCLCLSLE